MNVAFDGGNHQGAFGAIGGVFLLHEGFEVRDGGFHGLGRLQHERQLHLPRAKQFANHTHPVQQVDIDDVQGGIELQRFVQSFIQSLTLAVDDVAFEALV